MAGTLTLVIPCYNEVARIDLDRFGAFRSSHPSVRLLFVDDGSTDGTAERLEQFVAPFGPDAQVLRQGVNRGKGEAVRSGLQRARADGAAIVGFLDADLSTPLDAVLDLASILDQRPEIHWVTAARVRLLGRDIQRRAVRHYLGRAFATAASLILAMPVYDTQCGAKLFRATAELDEVLARPFVSRWVFDVEMISRFDQIRSRTGGRPAADSIYEYPLASWSDVPGSKVKPRDFARAFVDLVKIWRDRAGFRGRPT